MARAPRGGLGGVYQQINTPNSYDDYDEEEEEDESWIYDSEVDARALEAGQRGRSSPSCSLCFRALEAGKTKAPRTLGPDGCSGRAMFGDKSRTPPKASGGPQDVP